MLPLPAVDVLLAGVVGGEREPLVVVPLEKVAEIPRAVADVDVGVREVGDAETAAAGVLRDAPGGGRRQLHEADGSGRASARPG